MNHVMFNSSATFPAHDFPERIGDDAKGFAGLERLRLELRVRYDSERVRKMAQRVMRMMRRRERDAIVEGFTC